MARAGSGAGKTTMIRTLLDHICPTCRRASIFGPTKPSSHGVWDVAGVVACLVLAVGGIALGALAFDRRDLRS